MVRLEAFGALEHATKQQLAVNRLRRAIIAGDLAPGTWLRQDELSSVAGVSRTPIREALMQLASEGLVTMHPHKGVMANALSAEEFEDLYLVRQAVEPIAARLSAERIAAADLAAMQACMAELRVATDNFQAFLDAEGRMRQAQYAACGRPNLIRVVETFRERAGRYLYLFASFEGHTRDKLRLDEELLSAYLHHDGAAAERLTGEALQATVISLTPLLATGFWAEAVA